MTRTSEKRTIFEKDGGGFFILEDVSYGWFDAEERNIYYVCFKNGTTIKTTFPTEEEAKEYEDMLVIGIQDLAPTTYTPTGAQ